MIGKLGIISSSKLLTVFIKENMVMGLNSELEGVRVIHGKLWGTMFCLIEPDEGTDLKKLKLKELLSEFKIGQLISLGIGRSGLPVLQNGDMVISSEAILRSVGETDVGMSSEGGVIESVALQADLKLLDKILNSLERYGMEELTTKAVVGAVFTVLSNQPLATDYPDFSDSIHCWDDEGYFLAGECNRAGVPWALIRLILNEQEDSEKNLPNLKWDMAKKCFWIVKGILESQKRTGKRKHV